tara:strand:+ start:6097 stop:7680 length:1584 start_codon:yes stop_codon:yes gene_type:complete
MNIPIYTSEINDGLKEQIQNNSVACLSVAEVQRELTPEPLSYQKLVAENSTLADFFKDNDQAVAENRGQFDLYYMQSVLVTTGWNKNDDVFDPRETWEARSTAEDKPFNFMHDEKDIIGHITSNKVVDFEGNEIVDNGVIGNVVTPNSFEIVTSAVIYTEWQDPEQRQRIQKILAGIEQGDWFVSMECLFPDFDYALIKGDEQKIIKRSEASAFLTKHLRSYGGDGQYEDYRVGRLLRNLAFSGKGLVSKPANPRSIILQGKDSTQQFSESIAQDFNFTKPKENKMPNTDLEKQVSNLQAELAEANTANEALKDKVVAEQKAEYESQIEALATQVTESGETFKGAEATISDLNDKVVALEELVASKDKAMEDKDTELKAMKKKEAMMKRKAQLEEVGLDAEAASATMEDFADVDDNTFDKVVALMKKKAEMPDFLKKKFDKEDDKKDDKKDDKDSKAKNSEAEAVELEVEAKADEAAQAASEALETAEAPLENSIASSVDAGEEQADMRSSASAWINSFIQTNNNNK